MNFEELQYEESIDLKDFCIFILRKWRWLLVAVIFGAVMLGGYKYMFGAEQPVVSTISESTQKEIDAHERMINVHARKIVRLEAYIARYDIDIATQIEALEEYKTLLTEANGLLETELTDEARVELLAAITELNFRIVEGQGRLNTMQADQLQQKDEVLYYQEEIELLEETIEDLMGDVNNAVVEPVAVSMSSVLKYAVLGGIVGGMLVCGVAVVQYLTDSKLRRREEIKERYGLDVLGDFFVPDHKNMIDRMLDCWNGYRLQINREKEAALIAGKLRVIVPADEEHQQVIVTGTLERQELEWIGSCLQKNLPDGQYHIEVMGNPVYDAQAMLKMKDAKVVVAEARGISDKKEIKALLDVLQTGKSIVLGVILQ